MELVDLKDIVDGIVDFYELLIEDEGGCFEMDVFDGLQVEGQKDLISQVLVNLIENVLKYGCLKIGNLYVCLSVVLVSDCIVLIVVDNGLGILDGECE